MNKGIVSKKLTVSQYIINVKDVDKISALWYFMLMQTPFRLNDLVLVIVVISSMTIMLKGENYKIIKLSYNMQFDKINLTGFNFFSDRRYSFSSIVADYP